MILRESGVFFKKRSKFTLGVSDGIFAIPVKSFSKICIFQLHCRRATRKNRRTSEAAHSERWRVSESPDHAEGEDDPGVGGKARRTKGQEGEESGTDTSSLDLAPIIRS